MHPPSPLLIGQRTCSTSLPPRACVFCVRRSPPDRARSGLQVPELAEYRRRAKERLSAMNAAIEAITGDIPEELKRVNVA